MSEMKKEKGPAGSAVWRRQIWRGAVIKLISHLEDAEKVEAARFLFLHGGLNYQPTLFRLFIRFLLIALSRRNNHHTELCLE